MTTPQPTVTGYHAFTAAVAARDVDALVDALAPDAVLHSAVTAAPFEGREVLADLYASLFESFEDLRVVDEFQTGSTHAFFWEGRIDGRPVAGADRLRLDEERRVREITVVGRPLSGLFHLSHRYRVPLRPPPPRSLRGRPASVECAPARAPVLAARSADSVARAGPGCPRR